MDYPTYDPQSPNTPLTDEELRALDDLLNTVPSDGAMSLDGMDGYLTALVIGPPLLKTMPTIDWLPAIWGGDLEPGSPAPFASNQKRKRTTVLVLRHLQSIATQLRTDPGNWEPVLSVAEAPDGTRELADATEWCMGFLQATDLAPDDWAPLFADPDLGPLLAPIALLGGDVEAETAAGADGDVDDLDDADVRDRLSRAATEGVIALWARTSGILPGDVKVAGGSTAKQ